MMRACDLLSCSSLGVVWCDDVLCDISSLYGLYEIIVQAQF